MDNCRIDFCLTHYSFAYNNGITATAQKVELKKEPEGWGISHLTDLQIVNGGQTTASPFHTRRKDRASLDKIFVQVKLSVIDPARSEEIVPKISEYANTQNKVNAADFFSNAPFHMQIQEISRRLIAPARPGAVSGTKWFYERVRGQYVEAQSKLTSAETKKFQAEFPKQQVFSKEDLAKYENVWDEPPQIVSQGRQKNFAAYAERIGKEWEKDSTSFNEGYYKQAIARAILFRETEKIVSGRPWYEKGGSIRSYIVYYSLACLGELARRRKTVIPFMVVWDQQDVPDFLRDAIAKSADYINDQIKNPTDNSPRDSEWFKRPICWTTLQNGIERLEAELTDKFWNNLVSRAEYDAWVREGQQGQGVDNGIQAQTQVVNIPAAEWQTILTEMQSKGLLIPKETDILRIATQIPNRIPTDKQCKVLLDIRRRAIDEGIVSES